MDLSNENWMTVYEAAKFLRVSRATVYRLVQEGITGMGTPPYYRVGNRILFDREELMAWFKRGGSPDLEPKADDQPGANI